MFPASPRSPANVPSKSAVGSAAAQRAGVAIPSGSPAEYTRAPRLNALDLVGMLAGFALILAIPCVFSRGHIFWEDEMLGWVLLTDPSWRHMLAAWKLGADGGSFLFYVSARTWLHLFGATALAFRLYSAFGFGLAFAASWAAARRFYKPGIVAFALFNTFFFSPPMLMQMWNGRFYGLLILAVSLGFWLAFCLDEAPRPTPIRFYAAVFLVHALLTASHTLGIVFSAFLLAATVWLDLLAKRMRPLLYACGALGWLVLIPERANIINSAQVGKPWFWTTPPTLSSTIGIYTGSSLEILSVLLLLLCLAAWAFLRGRAGWRASLKTAYSNRRPVYIVTASMLLCSLAFLAAGLSGTWIFNNRYLLPIIIALVYITCELAQIATSILPLTITSEANGRRVFVAASLVFAAVLLLWVFRGKSISPAQPDYTAPLTSMLPKGIPVVCEDGFSFAELMGRQHASGVPYMFLLDWDYSVSRSAPRFEVMQYHLMNNWRRAGYFSGAIEPLADFLHQHDAFFVVQAAFTAPGTQPPVGNPIHRRLALDPAFQVREFAQLDRGSIVNTVWLVCRGQCPAGLGTEPPEKAKFAAGLNTPTLQR